MSDVEYDLVVVGGGPGGYTGAIRAAQLGMRVACIEKEPLLGGTCLRIGCIPSKALLESSHRYAELKEGLAAHGISAADVKLDLPTMFKRKTDVVEGLAQGIAGLFKKHKITRLTGHATLLTPLPSGPHRIDIEKAGEGKKQVQTKWVMVATGSKESRLPGVQLDNDRIGSSTEALAYPTVPEHLVVVGAGAIGLEMGSVWRRLGAKVTVLEYADRILAGMDGELAKNAERIFAKQGLDIRLKSQVQGVRREGDVCYVDVAGSDPLRCDRVLVAVGRAPNTDNLGLHSVGISVDKRGRIPIGEHFATSVPGIYAVGDVVVGPMLAHKAEEEAVACVEYLATGYGHIDYDCIPYVVYTAPEVASVGQTEEQLKQAGVPYKKGSFGFIANARARAVGDTAGMVKVLAHEHTDRILGVHMINAHASELIGEAAASMAFGASSEDLARVCHAHPTLAEAIKEAALSVDKRSLNS